MLRYGPCVTMGSHSFTCHPHTDHTCLCSSAARHCHPLAGTHCNYPRRDGQAELTWGGWLHTELNVLTTNWTRIRSPIPVLTGPDVGWRHLLLMCATPLLLSQANRMS